MFGRCLGILLREVWKDDFCHLMIGKELPDAVRSQHYYFVFWRELEGCHLGYRIDTNTSGS